MSIGNEKYELEDGTPVPIPEIVNALSGTILVTFNGSPQFVSVMGKTPNGKIRVHPCLFPVI